MAARSTPQMNDPIERAIAWMLSDIVGMELEALGDHLSMFQLEQVLREGAARIVAAAKNEVA